MIYENFINNNNKIDYHVILMSSNLERSENIVKMKKKIDKNIKHFEAIMGADLLNNNQLDINKIIKYDNKINFSFSYKYINEVGCYLSHFVLIKSLLDSPYDYTVIFEDDFYILNDNFNEQLNKILDSIDIDFDLLYLGNFTNSAEPYNYGNNYKNNIYYINKNNDLYGTHAYVINNKKIKKIYNYLLDFNLAIDNKYKYLIDNNLLIGLVIYPILVIQNNLHSTIR